MSEIQVAKRFVVNKLRADATVLATVPATSIVQERQDEDATPPYIIVANSRAASDFMGVGTIRIKSDVHVLVKVVAFGASFKDYEALVDRIDVLLHGTKGPVVGGGTIVACVRETPVAYMESNEGVEYIHFGAVYWIQAQQ